MKKNRVVLSLIAAVLCFVLTACGQTAETEEPSSQTQAESENSQAGETGAPAPSKETSEVAQSTASEEQENNAQPMTPVDVTDEPEAPMPEELPQDLKGSAIYRNGVNYGNSAGNLNQGGMMLKAGNVLCYFNYIDGTGETLNLNNYEITRFSDKPITMLNLVDGWIYGVLKDTKGYPDVEDGIIKVRPDGSGERRLLNGSIANMQVVDDTIYFINEENRYLYSMSVEGGEPKLLLDRRCYYLCVEGATIFFQSSDDGEALYSIQTDGSDLRRLNSIPSWMPVFEEGWIYYESMEGEDRSNPDSYTIRKIRPSGLEDQLVAEIYAEGLNIDNGLMYFSNMEDNGCLYTMQLDGTYLQKYPYEEAIINNRDYIFNANIYNLETITSTTVKNPNVAGGYVHMMATVNLTGKDVAFPFIMNADRSFFSTFSYLSSK